jgi:serine/threonine protein kinase
LFSDFPLKHEPNVLNVTDFGTDPDGTAFIVTEHFEGETLKEAVKNQGKFSTARAANIVNQIAAALTNAHSYGIIHRNLSSDNIQLLQTPTTSDVVKILDFGTVKLDESDVTDSKPEYLSPEQCSESSEPDERSDVYSLGIILYEMLTGEVPFSGTTKTDVMMKHVQEPPPPILSLRSDLPVETETIIQRSLAKQPIQRFQSATDLADSFQRVSTPTEFEQETIIRSKPFISDGSNAIASPANLPPRNNVWKTAFIVLAGICVLGGSFIYMTYGKRTNPGTEMMLDANGQPVQPMNPATGATEQELSNMSSYSPDLYGNSNINGMPLAMPNDPNPLWDRGYKTAPGMPIGSETVPYPVTPSQGGPMIYTDGNGSQFMPDINNPGMFVPVPTPVPNANKSSVNANVKVGNTNVKVNANVGTVKPPSNTSVNIKPSATPPATPKPTPIPLVTPTPKPVEEPKPTKPPVTGKQVTSGKERDTF